MNPRREALTPRKHAMRNDPIHTDFDSLSPELRRIDALLAQEAAGFAVPEGLADRVFASSRTMLPRGAGSAAAEPSWRLVGADGQVQRTIARPSRRTVWGRLAMAASIAVVFAIGGRTLLNPAPTEPVVDGAPIVFLPISDRSEYELSLEVGDDQTGAILTARDSEYDDLDRELRALNVVLSSIR